MTNTEFLYPWNQKLYESEACEHFVDRELSYTVIENGYIVPSLARFADGGVFDENRNFLDKTACHNGIRIDFPENCEIVRSDETVIYLGNLFYRCWGHVITDQLSRLWFVKYSEDYRTKFRNCALIYTEHNTACAPYVRELLEILGIDCDRLTHIRRVTQYKKIIIPDQCFFNEWPSNKKSETRFFTKEYRQLIEEIRAWGRAHKRELPFDKVYYTYGKFLKILAPEKNRYEYVLEEFFRKLGYEIIAPEEYSFKEQLNILLNCRCFASTIGSCSHNSVFLENGTNVYLLLRADYFTGYQLAINEVWDQNVYLIDSQLSILADAKNPWSGPYYYCVSDNLMRCFSVGEETGGNCRKRDLRNFKRYVSVNAEWFDYAFDDHAEKYFLALQYLTEQENSRIAAAVSKMFRTFFYTARRTVLYLYYKVISKISH